MGRKKERGKKDIGDPPWERGGVVIDELVGARAKGALKKQTCIQ